MKNSARPSLEALGLSKNPFREATDEFFGEGDRGRRLEELRHLARWSRRLLVVTGERGVGKSTLYRALSSGLDPGVKAARINANLTSDTREVLAGIIQGFGMAAPANADPRLLIELIALHVQEQIDAHRYCLVLIDDAHLLELRALEQLLKLVDAGAEDGLRIVFFAEAYFVQSLDKASKRTDQAQNWHEIRLTPFTDDESRRYVAFRLAQAGLQRSLGVHAERTVGDRRRIERHARAHRRTGERHPHRRSHDQRRAALVAADAPRAGRTGVDRCRSRMVDLQRISETHRRTARRARPSRRSEPASAPVSGTATLAIPRPPVAGVAESAAASGCANAGGNAEDTGRTIGGDCGCRRLTAAVARTETRRVPAGAGRAETRCAASRKPIAEPPQEGARGGATGCERESNRSAPEFGRWQAAIGAMDYAISPASTSRCSCSRPPAATSAISSCASRTTRSSSRRSRRSATACPGIAVAYGSYATQAEAKSAAASLPASVGRVEPWVRTFASVQATLD